MIIVGAVRDESNEHPIKFLSMKDLTGRGDRFSIVSKEEVDSLELLALLRMKGERRCVVSSCPVTSYAKIIERPRWRSEGDAIRRVQF